MFQRIVQSYWNKEYPTNEFLYRNSKADFIFIRKVEIHNI
ncbi:hypothetical protein LEP1GSC066_0446 [Leptospira sp. serovar Kenya str. Sh9]|uniref:Uncharacterized protein n=1 Tax=Leptospira borgpetersenii serovar Ballum TaxID=280505 RepID=A0A0S2IV03_LEPBO|nr:hypothetical protein LBBP_03274 [Leptospira borgpetersenii serovar Ballum]EMK10517.1 hypothetical protein LEP1GSC066_0446 [Leptospira sp. serovar Kenya str. Sh9]EMN57991.1 hypothetical protein LEP1GSC090_3806 [Leptospira borgpetersenii serovar Javanica str. MK146]